MACRSPNLGVAHEIAHIEAPMRVRSHVELGLPAHNLSAIEILPLTARAAAGGKAARSDHAGPRARVTLAMGSST